MDLNWSCRIKREWDTSLCDCVSAKFGPPGNSLGEFLEANNSLLDFQSVFMESGRVSGRQEA